jgi:peptide deformylase
MILPILSYGHPVLRARCSEIGPDYKDLDRLIENMWETMYNANGCGLAAPQVNHTIRLFVVDSKKTFDMLKPEERPFYFQDNDQGFVETFINPKIIERSEETWEDEEGCLSIPNLVRPVERSMKITIEYSDKYFQQHIRSFSGTTARMIQHEYDHVEGVLYFDYLKPLARKLLAGRLKKISTGLLPAKYPMIYLKK